jgi:hypothetical protein
MKSAKLHGHFAAAKAGGQLGVRHRSQQAVICISPGHRLQSERRDTQRVPTLTNRLDRPSEAAREVLVDKCTQQKPS